MKVAFLCPGLGNADRGYERFAEDLYATLKGRIDITLYRGAGPERAGQVSVGWPGRDHPVVRALGRGSRDVYFWEALFFTIRAWRAVAHGGFDLIHYSEPPLNGILTRFGAVLPSKAKRLFSHGVGMSPDHYRRCHFAHQVSQTEYDRGLAGGIPTTRTRLIPYGINTERFQRSSDEERAALRRKHGVPENVFAILAVSAVNDRHKRVGHLVRVVAGLDEPFHLVVCGKPEEPALLEQARFSLRERFHHLYVQPEAVNDVYGLADVFILGSLEEGAPISISEAGLAGLPLVLAEQARLQWLASQGSAFHIDMTDEEATRAMLRRVRSDIAQLRIAAADVRPLLVSRFSWEGLAPSYMAMYEDVVQGPDSLISDTHPSR